MYKTRFEPFRWNLGRCVKGRNGDLLYAENVVCDVSALQVEGNVSGILVTDKIAQQNESNRVAGEYTYENPSFVAAKAMENHFGAPV